MRHITETHVNEVENQLIGITAKGEKVILGEAHEIKRIRENKGTLSLVLIFSFYLFMAVAFLATDF